MSNRNVHQLLKDLEEGAGDELELLESTGPEFFPTPQLWRLLGQWEVKNRLFHLFQRWLLRFIAFSPVWLAGWALFAFFGWPFPALLSLQLFPISFLLFAGGLWWMRQTFRGRGHLDAVGELIKTELRRRASRPENS